MRRKHVTSSVIEAAGYDSEMNVLEVEFRTGRVYQYFFVPLVTYEALIHAASVGEYFNREIRSRYPHAQVTTDEPRQ